MAYHAGALRALEEVGGYRPDDADLVIGTSAGSMMGALVRSGIETEDLFAAALGEHPTLSMTRPDESPWEQTWRDPADLVRRVLGASYVLQRSLLRIPGPRLPRSLRRLFPGGFYAVADAETRLGDVMANEWPDKPLWLISVDVRTGRRVVLGRRNPPRAGLFDAVLASCAIPAFFQPIRAANRTLVDGGVHSTTNLDLATKIQPGPDRRRSCRWRGTQSSPLLRPMRRLGRHVPQRSRCDARWTRRADAVARRCSPSGRPPLTSMRSART